MCSSVASFAHQAVFGEFLDYWPEYSENKLKVAWKKTKKGKFSLKKEPRSPGATGS